MAPIYSICISNYNMASTLEASLRSIFSQITSSYEVVVIDDGSTDNSLEILQSLKLEFSCLRYIPLSRDTRRKLGETRNVSIRAARGTYCILHIDTDDIWEYFIPTFTHLFHDIETRLSINDFLLSGLQIQMAPKKLFMENPYLNVYYGEDRCLWTSLAAIGKLISINHKIMRRRVDYRSRRSKLVKVLSSQYSGLLSTFSTSPSPIATLLSYIQQIFGKSLVSGDSFLVRLVKIVFLPPAFVAGFLCRQDYVARCWTGYRQHTLLDLAEFEKMHTLEFGRFNLSKAERKLFFLND